jgi:thymus-specific serine protease
MREYLHQQSSHNITVDPAIDLPTVDPNDFEELNFDNLVDHYNFQSDATYSQRYWRNDKFWTSTDGPNFLYICGEYRCSIREDRLYPFMVGASHGGRLFALEHRFYGDSQPYDDWSLESL